MKKLLAVVAVCAALAGSLFAKENVISLGLGPEILSTKSGDNKVSYSGLSFGLHTATMYSDMLGLGSSVSIAFPSKLSSNGISVKLKEAKITMFDMDSQIGVAIRPVNAEKFYFIVTPGIDLNMMYAKQELYGTSSNLQIAFGPGVQLNGGFKITDFIAVSANIDLAYDIAGIVLDSVAGSSSDIEKPFVFLPSFGVTFTL